MPDSNIRENLHNGQMKDFVSDPNPISGPLQGRNLCVVGAGFVGAVAASGFAKFGHSVICLENNPKRLEKLKEGEIPFYERDLEELVKTGLSTGRLVFSDDIDEAASKCDVFFIAVGTPSDDSGRADLSALMDVMNELSVRLNSEKVLVIKSTVPIGTADNIRGLLNQNVHNRNIPAIVNNPEFLREGSAVYDFFHPQRIVLGGDNDSALENVKSVYRLGMIDSIPFIITNNKTAETIKYASNIFLATKIGFINEMARLCDKLNVNILEVAHATGLDARIGGQFLDPGPGWGGSCLPKDLSEILGIAKTEDIDMNILMGVLESNNRQHDYVIDRMADNLGELEGKTVGVLGLAFKANTSDTRESPALKIINRLLDKDVKVKAYDPAITHTNNNGLPKSIVLADTPYSALENTDCILILTEWPDFQTLDWKKIGDIVNSKLVFDMRNLLSPDNIRMYGFEYESMGQF